MTKNSRVFQFAGVILFSLFVVGVSTAMEPEKKEGSMVVADMNENQENKKDSDGKKNTDCPPQAPCASHAATGGPSDVASDNSSCTSGRACDDRMAHCSYANAGTCTTIPLGAGNCKCICAMP